MKTEIVVGIIGVVGTLLGVVVGFGLECIRSSVGKRALSIELKELCIEKIVPDGCGDYFGDRRLEFKCIFVNRKLNPEIVEKLECIYYKKNKKIGSFKCCYKSSVGRSYNDITVINIPGKSSNVIDVIAFPPETAIGCDKIELQYSYGYIKRKKTIWKQNMK